jgi:hypothetical protein
VIKKREPGLILGGVAAVEVVAVVAILGANLLGHLAYLPLPWHAQAAIHDAAALPDSLGTCGRNWNRSSNPPLTMAQISDQYGSDAPAVADPGLLTACPANACNAWASAPCDPVIFVRVDEDAYIAHALSGGP